MPQTIDNLSATWSNSLTTYTAFKFNILDSASAAGSLLMDLQVSGTSIFAVRRASFSGTKYNRAVVVLPQYSYSSIQTGGFFTIGVDESTPNIALNSASGGGIDFVAGSPLRWRDSTTNATGGVADLILTRRGTANLRLGAADAATAVAQTLSVQSGTAGASALSCSISGTTLTVGGAVTGTIAIGHAVTGTGVSAGTLITAGSGTTWTVNNSQTVSSTTMYFNSVGRDFTITGSQASGPSPGGSIVFQVAPAGAAGTTAQNALATALTIDSTKSLLLANNSTSSPGIQFAINGGYLASIYASQYAIELGITTTVGGAFSSTFGTLKYGVSSKDLTFGAGSSAIGVIALDAANTLALRNGTAAQAFRVYNTYDGTNDERGFIKWSSNVLQIGTEKTGTGTARALEFQTDGTTRLTIASGGNITTTGTLQVPSSGGRSIICGGKFEIGAGSSSIVNKSDGVFAISNYNETDFGRLQFGGTTSSFPALKRSSTTLQARLADDSAFATIQGKLRADVNAVAETPTATHTITITDAAGTAYKVLCVAA